MENVVLTIHLILALLLIGVVLLQRNEGGSLLSGGGAMTARGAANAVPFSSTIPTASAPVIDPCAIRMQRRMMISVEATHICP